VIDRFDGADVIARASACPQRATAAWAGSVSMDKGVSRNPRPG
jgi:hypothetical protein